MTHPHGVARTLPRGLAPIVEALEMEQATLVTAGTLDEIRSRAGLATPARILAARLRERGWLLATSRRGVYEFAPGAHAGALSRGDVTLPLQAALHSRPHLVAGLTMQSAAWALNAADRAPTRLEVVAADKDALQQLKSTLGDRARVMSFRPRLPWEHHRGVPVLSAESVLTHMAAKPGDVRSWDSALDWLPDLASDADEARLMIEVQDRPRAVTARLAYLLSGLRPDLAQALDGCLEARTPSDTQQRVYFGPRGSMRRHDAARHVADTLLPFDPRQLEPVTR